MASAAGKAGRCGRCDAQRWDRNRRLPGPLGGRVLMADSVVMPKRRVR